MRRWCSLLSLVSCRRSLFVVWCLVLSIAWLGVVAFILFVCWCVALSNVVVEWSCRHRRCWFVSSVVVVCCVLYGVVCVVVVCCCRVRWLLPPPHFLNKSKQITLFAVYVNCCCSVLLFVCGCWSSFDVGGLLLWCVDCVARSCCSSFVVCCWMSCLVVLVVG